MQTADAVRETLQPQAAPRLPDGEFFRLVTKRNTGPDGQPLDPTLFRRLGNEICVRCQESYRLKFPGRPFKITCKGIYSQPDFIELAAKTKLTLEEVRDLLDVPYWASRHIKIPNADGDLECFIARDYQCESLLCTTSRQVDRWGRGNGKTLISIIKELHVATTRRRHNTLIACPAKAQAQKWFDDINQMIQADAGLASALVGTRQQPYYTFRFANGTTINIFTTGSQSGRDADVVRSQSPRRVCIDEQDLLNPGDYKAIMPLLRRFPDSEFHGMSTPTGKRETFWQMCKEFGDYRELHFPASRHPDWNKEKEEACRREARTDINYQHEFEAEFGEQEGGVFKSIYVDAAKQPYIYRDLNPRDECWKGWKFFLGVDWNGQGTGSRMRVVGYNPETRRRKCVDLAAVSTNTMDTLDTLRDLNRRWHCIGVYIDAGFGYVQDELIKLIGYHSNDPDDKRLLDIKVVDFGANMKTNKLVPNRGNDKYLQKQELERPTKPFMVEGAQMVLEMGDFEFSDGDTLLEEQLRAYRVKTYSRHGWANTYESRVGDHDLDALVLALLGVELKFGLTKIADRGPRHSSVEYVAAFGLGTPTPNAPKDYIGGTTIQSPREAMQEKANVPSRAVMPSGNMGAAGVRNVIGKGAMGAPVSYIEYPGGPPASAGQRRSANFGAASAQGATNGGNIPSRTSMFRNGGRAMGMGATGGGRRGPANGKGLYTR